MHLCVWLGGVQTGPPTCRDLWRSRVGGPEWSVVLGTVQS